MERRWAAELSESTMTRPLSRTQALWLGVVAAAALAIGGWRLLTLPQNNAWARDAITVTAPFRDVGGLLPGTRVHVQGVDVGEVAAVRLPDVAGDPVTVELRLAGHLRSRLGTDAQVSIARESPIGERLVRLVPGGPDSPRLHDGAVLASADTPDLFAGLTQTAGKLNAILGDMDAVLQTLKQGEQTFTQDVAQSARKLNTVLTRLDQSLVQVEAGKGTLGKLLQDEKLYDELTAAVRELKATAYDIRKGEGTLGALVKDRAAYEKTLETVEDVRAMIASVKQNSDAVRSLPVVRSYVVDVNKELVRPDMKRLRKVYAESELFEPGRAVLTGKGKAKLDGAIEWLKGYKTGEVVIAGIAAPATNANFAQTLTQKQSDAVRDYLVSNSVHRTGWWWWNTRPVRALGCGNQPPAQPEAENLPPSRVEVILFLAEK
jgi:phospholipid/cholesterol/gamma-HCH transport system substrate-binding protein